MAAGKVFVPLCPGKDGSCMRHPSGLGAPARDGHVQRVYDEFGAHVLGHAPVDDRAASGILAAAKYSQPARF
jgi:hypothetical protein